MSQPWEESLFKTKHEPIQFKKNGWGLLPKGSVVYPVFLVKSITGDENTVYAGGPKLSSRQWVVSKESAFKSVDLMIDSEFKDWDKKMLSFKQNIDSLLLVQLREPVGSLQGRIYVGFLLNLEDLIPYVH